MRGHVFLQRPAVDLCAAWCGSGLLIASVGVLLSMTASVPVDVVGLILFLAGGVLVAVGGAFYVYLPRRLRPGQVQMLWRLGPARRQETSASPDERPLRLVHHVLRGNLRTSEEEAREITRVGRPRLLVLGRISGPLPYAAGISRTPRNGALWVVPGRVLFVQSAEDDRRLGESNFVEIPAEKLHALRVDDGREKSTTWRLPPTRASSGSSTTVTQRRFDTTFSRF